MLRAGRHPAAADSGHRGSAAGQRQTAAGAGGERNPPAVPGLSFCPGFDGIPDRTVFQLPAAVPAAVGVDCVCGAPETVAAYSVVRVGAAFADSVHPGPAETGQDRLPESRGGIRGDGIVRADSLRPVRDHRQAV
ncbi:hypothetical protein SDC9_173012 [bioreactor metagenome]|uniref:Uncharacterized protein n=1 Tax=bioreactor metagenome TaxID=1076179 RepID=A0A645GHH3_9ZZZZ